MNNVALFIDLDNIRIGMSEKFGVQLKPQVLIDIARQYGSFVAIAKAYANFAQADLATLRDKLAAAGIDDLDVPARMVNGKPKDYVDFHMLLDIYDTLVERSDIDTFVLATGDDHYLRLAAKLRHRHGKQVVIVGVPGTISQRLRESANAVEELEPPAEAVPTDAEVLQTIEGLKEKLPYVTRKYICDVMIARHPLLAASGMQDILRRLEKEQVLAVEVAETPHGQKTIVKVVGGPESIQAAP